MQAMTSWPLLSPVSAWHSRCNWAAFRTGKILIYHACTPPSGCPLSRCLLPGLARGLYLMLVIFRIPVKHAESFCSAQVSTQSRSLALLRFVQCYLSIAGCADLTDSAKLSRAMLWLASALVYRLERAQSWALYFFGFPYVDHRTYLWKAADLYRMAVHTHVIMVIRYI